MNIAAKWPPPSTKSGSSPFSWRSAGLFLAQAALILSMACGGGGGGGGGTTNPNTAPLITTQPASQTVNAGSPATFTAAASGTPAPTFTWQRSNNGGTTWTAIPGATSATYTTAATVKTDNAAQFRAVATNTVSPDAISTPATLTVRWLAITTQPANVSVTAGASATFTVVPDASPVATYQWQSSTNGTTWANVSGGTGATSASYTTAATSSSDNGTQYRCALTNAVGTLNSNGATLTVITVPVITGFVAAKSPITTGTGTTLTAVFTGGTGTVDHGIGAVTSGVAVPTGNLATTTIFTLTVAGATGTTVSLPVTVTVVAAPTTPVVTAPASVTANQAGYTASVPAQAGCTYAWTITNGSITAGATTTRITFTAGASGSTIPSCIVTNAAGTASTAGTATCTIVAAPAITSFTASGGLSTITITNGFSTTLSFTFSGGTGSIDQGVGSVTSLGTRNVSPTVTTTYTLTVTNGVNTPATAQVTVNVVDPPVITSFTAADSPIVSGTSTTLTGKFTGGTGSVDHGVGAMTTAVAKTTGNLTTTTTFTLTVTNTATTPASATATATVTVGNTLTVNITGLGNLPGNVVVTGPSGYTSAVLTAATQTLSGLADGVYTITPATVTDPSQPGQGRGADGTGTPGTLGPANLQRYPALLSLTQTLALAGTNTAAVAVDYPAPYLTVTVPGTSTSSGLSTSIDLVLVPAGTFTMGETETVIGSDPWAQPSHGVTLGKAFYIAKVPCTQAQWVAIMNNNPAHFTAGNGFPNPNELFRPVEKVDFNAITTAGTGFLDMLNSASASVLTGPLAGSSFRLPTEAEYEYACRAGSESTVLNVPDPLNNNYYFGSYDPGGGDPAVILLVQKYMWYADNSNLTTQPVAQKLPNAWGLYDMIGNVWELCRDDWHTDYSVTGAGIPPLPIDGSAWLDVTPNIQHSYKGGSWYGPAGNGQSKRRGPYPLITNPPDPANEYAGFRVVLPLP